MNDLWQAITARIGEATGKPWRMREQRAVGGGSINEAWRVGDGEREWFVKLNSADRVEMFAAEAEGLQALAEADAIRVPAPLDWGCHGRRSFLILEYLPLRGSPDPKDFATALATMHRHTASSYGWHRDNTIGSTPQINRQSEDWIDFWRERRLLFQLDLAQQSGASSRLIDRGRELAERLPAFFATWTPPASVLHGDLWSGNWGADDSGAPVIFDPAVYFGDHETDLAMMTLFGHPGRGFFERYDEVFPIDDGFSTRRTLYNLYHILNHFNLFGGGYGSQAESMIDQLLAELG